jgi:hypothetical protein
MAGPTACEQRWKAVLESFANQEPELIAENPDAKEEINLIHTALVTIGQLVHMSPRINGNGVIWKELAEKSEPEPQVLCKHMDGKALFTAVLRLYAAMHREMRESVVHHTEEDHAQNEEFREQKRR